MTRPMLNRPLVLERQDRVPDGAGGYVPTWVALGTLWAEMAARNGRLRGVAGEALSVADYRIRVRGAPVGSAMRPQPGQRFRDGGRVFAIRAVTESGPDGRYLLCRVDEEDSA